MTTWKDAPNRTIEVDGTRFTYRELGSGSGVPVVFLHHLTAVLDDWDPRVIDGIAARHRVIAFDNRGVGGTGGSVPPTVEQMGTDAIAFIRALGLGAVDLLGFSLGGGVAQMVALQAPELVRRMILAGTGPRGGGGIDKMATIVGSAYAKAALTRSDPRNFLFFPRTPEGKRAAADYFDRLAERRHDRDQKISLQARIAQIKAIRHAGRSRPDDLSVITQPVFVANGDHDLMVDSAHSADMARRIPNAHLKIYPNSGHGGVFQHHQTFVPDALQFLADQLPRQPGNHHERRIRRRHHVVRTRTAPDHHEGLPDPAEGHQALGTRHPGRSVENQPAHPHRHGDNDRMVPSALSEDMQRRIAGSQLVIHPDSGHGGIFQYHDEFSSRAIAFLDD